MTPARVLAAYRRGLFPMATSRNGRIVWVSPEVRSILPLDTFHIPTTTRRAAKKFRVTFDRAFEQVVEGCADRAETWISDELRDAYVALHRRGDARSVESWAGGELAGGVYGVHVEGAFMAESMFHRRTEAGKVALAALLEHLCRRKFSLCDIQMVTPITARFGAVEISRDEYRERLARALVKPVCYYSI